MDRHLSAEGRLVLVESPADVETKIPIVKRHRKALAEATSKRTLTQVVDTIQEIAESSSFRALTLEGPSLIKLLIIAGARPNFMKVAPLIKAIEARRVECLDGEKKVEYRLVHTGQHYDAKMSDIFFGELGIPAPDINLEVGSGSHAIQTANIMAKFEPVCEREKPNWVVVVGDVNSTMACTLVSAKLGIKVAHVEAGLRSFDHSDARRSESHSH